MVSASVTEPVTIQVHPTVVHLDESILFVQLREEGGIDNAH
jgi:hypothetical protein